MIIILKNTAVSRNGDDKFMINLKNITVGGNGVNKMTMILQNSNGNLTSLIRNSFQKQEGDTPLPVRNIFFSWLVTQL